MTKDHKLKIRQATTENWQNPIFRIRICKAMRDAWTPERKRHLRKRMLGHEHSEAIKERISFSNIETWNRRRNEQCPNDKV